MKVFGRIVAINVGLLVCGLLIIELLAGSWFDEHALGDLDIPAHRAQAMDVSGLYPGGGIVRWQRDQYGLRGHYPSPDRIDILAVGGSTTAESLVNDGETWTDVLAQKLSTSSHAIYVANAGLDGHSTFGHLNAFKAWFPRIGGLRPRFVLFYVGINDAAIASANPIFDDFQPSTTAEQIRNRIYNDSVLYHLYRKVRGLYRAHIAGVIHQPGKEDFMDLGDGTLVRISSKQMSNIEASLPAEGYLENYRQRLRQLGRAAHALGARSIFVNQLWRGIFARPEGFFVRSHHVGNVESLISQYGISRAYARATLEGCKLVEMAICIDLASDLMLEPGDLYDFVHATPMGSAKIGTFLSERLRPLKVVP